MKRVTTNGKCLKLCAIMLPCNAADRMYARRFDGLRQWLRDVKKDLRGIVKQREARLLILRNNIRNIEAQLQKRENEPFDRYNLKWLSFVVLLIFPSDFTAFTTGLW